jgi:long-chain fatty acid transport protein
VQVGAHYDTGTGLRTSASVKSPQFFQDFEFESGDRTFSYALDYPMIISAAAAYEGLDRVTVVGDVRYIDFANTDGFQAAGFDATGAVTGFGWESIWVVALGVEVEVTDRLPVRLGYAYNQNPIRDEVAFYNVASPAIVQHHISGGGSYHVTDRVMASVAVQYAPRNEVTSEMQSPILLQATGSSSVPGTAVTSELSTVTAVAGVSVRF